MATPTAQRLFGFEFELGVPVFSRQNGNESYPRKSAGVKEIATANDESFDIHIDHNADVAKALPDEVLRGKNRLAAIVELVTRPMDEFAMEEDDVKNVMNNLENVADHIRANALGQDTDIPLDELPGMNASPAGVNFVGHAAEPADRGLLSVDAYVQATFGLSLKRVGEEFTSRAAGPDLPGETSAMYRSYRMFKVALYGAAKIGRVLINKVSQEKNSEGEYGGEAELSQAQGLLTLIAYYLQAGRIRFAAPLLKNRTGIFYYKTSLSTVRNGLCQLHPELDDFFLFEADWLSKALLKLAKRKPGDPVFLGMDPVVTCKDWIESVLAGTGDLIYDWSVNEASDELEAPDIGQGQARGYGVVMENRRYAETEGGIASRKYPPNEWADMAVKLHRHLRARQGVVVTDDTL